MTVRKLKSKQRGPWCSYCEKERASHRGLGFTKFACQNHLAIMREEDERRAQRNSYQTTAEFELGL